LNTELHPAAEQWVGILNGKLVCHRGIIQYPMRKGWKRGHRMVVLPDFQGIGIGTAFEEYTSQYYADAGWNVAVLTTTPSLVNALKNSKKWKLIRSGRADKRGIKEFAKHYNNVNKKSIEAISKTTSKNRVTYSFVFIK
jgi:GNAT superfamily N-acetyltransferase